MSIKSKTKRCLEVIEDRLGLAAWLGPIMRHPVPRATGWKYVFGSATLIAFVLQVVTGVILATAYVPSTSQAYSSLQFITHDAFLGNVLRGLHYFGAGAMVLLIGIHTIRVFLMGAYKFPREVNWLSGSILMVLTLGMAFTGQLLRWDQTALWSVVVGAEQAARVPWIGTAIAHFVMAGDTIGGATLSRFFALHVFILPAGLFLFIAIHLYLVVKHGISEPPVPGHPVDPKTYRKEYEELLRRDGVPFWPDAAWRDAIFGLLVVVVIAILAIVIGPPELGRIPDPTILNAYPRPDWYFLWYFSVLALSPHKLEPFIVVLGPTLFGLLLFVLPFAGSKGERAPSRRPWAVGSVIIVLIIMWTLWWEGKRAPWSPDFTAQPLSAAVVGTSTGPVAQGALLFHQKGCEYCHRIDGSGGRRGPDLSTVGERLTKVEMTIRILNGGFNMPGFATALKPGELDDIVAFLETRKGAVPRSVSNSETGALQKH